MSNKNVFGNEVSVDEQAFENPTKELAGEDESEVVDERPEFRPTVEMEVQAKVDANHPDGLVDTSGERIDGASLAQEERIQARELELERIRARARIGTKDGRARRTRSVVAGQSDNRRATFQKRAASVDPMADPERGDPREELSREQLAAVNEQSMRMAKKLNDWSQAAISRMLAEAVVDGKDLQSAVMDVFEELETAAGQVVPIRKLEDVQRSEVSIEGRVEVLWEPASPAIRQVGLIEDESGRTKFTSWVASDQPWMEEGEFVRIHGASKNWYDGRVSVALTGWTTVHFPKRGQWWE